MKGGNKFMSMNRKEKGFTIIEVVLVLAIAGLIFLMVFIALPALQRSQRDTQRKNDLSRMITQITSYSSNNRGAVPTAANFSLATTGFITKYLGGAGNVTGSDYLDPTEGTGYTAVINDPALYVAGGTGSAPAVGNIYYSPGFICGTDGVSTASTARHYVLKTVLEGQTAPYCIDNR
jgi:prepilin-type N-terminal cleavage/methylation domain-containing protein